MLPVGRVIITNGSVADTGLESSDGSESGSSSVASTGSSDSDEGRARRQSGRRRRGSGMWDLVNEMWPVEARPKLLQSRRVVEKMTIAEISQFKAHYEQEEEKKGGGAAVFGKDKKLRAVEFKKGKDNGTSKLHEARFELRMPFCMPKKYWHRLPPKREVFRHFPLSHLGMEGQVSETTVVRMHDRRVPVTLDMLCKGNAGKDLKVDKADWVEPTEVRHLQEAVLNYTVLLNALWPLDYAGLVITRVLVESSWGAVAGGSEKARVALVKKFFEETVRENSGRAVREEPPLVYEEARAKWVKVVENVFPGVLGVGMGPLAATMSAADGQKHPDGYTTLTKKGGAGRGAKQKGRGGRGGGFGGGGGGAVGGGPGAPPMGTSRTSAVASGLPVCFGYNQHEGCKRDVVKATVCNDANGMHFAHACNFLDRTTNKFCLQLHRRFGNH